LLEVPKVTRKTRFGGTGFPLFPSSGGADQAIGDQAEPEVDDHAHVELEGPVARQRKRRREQEIRHVAEDDGAESLD
jgi:hypothetical protein